MILNVQEKLIDQTNRNSLTIANELQNFLESNEGLNIKADIQLLNDMGFDKKMINKVYILLRPENLERAIDFLTEIDGLYQHNFIASSNPKEKALCFICKKTRQFHIDYIPNDLLNEDNNLINNEHDLINNDNIQENNKNDLIGECEVCYEEINEEDLKLNQTECGHLFCTHCWFNYLKTLITEAKVDDIKCMNHDCKEKMEDEFILKHISENENLIEKYKKFKKRSEIIKDKNKKLCPHPNCDSFLPKSNSSKYVQCENGHEYCFECLKAPHGKKSCDYEIENQFMIWKKGKRVKRCPRCQMYTEKNEGCNHMTCASCKYQWCWLCEGEYKYGHYDSGKCGGHQFTVADSLEEIKNKNIKLSQRYNPARNGDHSYFGIHKIFPCVFKDIYEPFDLDDPLWLKYLFIFGFWFFGFMTTFINTAMEHSGILLDDDCLDILFVVFNFLIGFVLSIPYQIALTCILTPFILIALVYHKFFGRILMFFALGDYY